MYSVRSQPSLWLYTTTFVMIRAQGDTQDARSQWRLMQICTLTATTVMDRESIRYPACSWECFWNVRRRLGSIYANQTFWQCFRDAFFERTLSSSFLILVLSGGFRTWSFVMTLVLSCTIGWTVFIFLFPLFTLLVCFPRAGTLTSITKVSISSSLSTVGYCTDI